jgi:sterol desaturase/sphingolipid hydroxylase (fatty acid hydroxylase superfamily)
MDFNWEFLSSKTTIIIAVFLSLFVLERLFSVAAWRGGLARVVRNLVLASFNFVLSPLIVIPITAFAAVHGLQWRPEWWSGWPGAVVDFLILDAWIYWWHRLNHRLPLLWRFHEVHHLDEMLDTTSALRFHFGEVVLSAVARAVVIYVLAVPLFSVVTFEILLLAATIFHHSNLRLPQKFEKALSFVIVTPGIHWVHHHAKRADTDSNYSTVLSVWDFVFSSRSRTARSPDMPIGVEGRAEKPLLSLVIRPFFEK